MENRQVAGWVWESNVRILFRWLSLYVTYDFDDSDWQAIHSALPATDDERIDSWYGYRLNGTPRLEVEVARTGDGPVMVRIAGAMDPILHGRVDTLVSVLADASLQR